MAFGRIFDILAAIVGVAMATVIVGNPSSANTIKAFGGAFSGSLRAAMGN